MADQDALFPELGIEFFAGDGRVPGEKEVGQRIGHFKTQLAQPPCGPGAGFHDVAAVVPEVCFIFQSADAGGHGHAVDVVGIGGILDGIQVPDQCPAADAQAQPGAGHGPGFGEGLGDQQIVVFVDEGNGALSAEVDVGFIDDHHGIRIGSDDGLDVLKGQVKACGGVGIGDEDGLADTAIIRDVDGKILLQGDLRKGNAIETGIDFVKTVGNVRDDHTPVAEGHECEIQYFVGAVGEEDLVFRYAPLFRRRPDQIPALRV